MNITARPRYRVVTAVSSPFVMYNSSSGSFYGYCIDLLESMSRISGFDYDLVESTDQLFGHVTESGEWTGMIADLLNDSADFAVAALWITHLRRQVVDYTIPFYKDNGFTIMMRRREQFNVFLWFLTILDLQVWLHFAITFLVTSILIRLFERFSPYSYSNMAESYTDEPDQRFASLRECFWFSLTALTPEGASAMPKSLSGKMAVAVWWLLVFVIVAAYNANLAAYRTLDRLERHIETIDNLRRQYQVDYSTIVDSATYRYFESLKDNEELLSSLWRQMSLDESVSDWERSQLTVWEYPVDDKYTKIYNAMRKTGLLANKEEAVNSVRRINRTREFAYIGEATQIRYLALTNCDLKQVGEEFGMRPFAFAVKKGSPLKSKLDDSITQVALRGIPLELEKKWWDENPARAQCPTNDGIDAGFTFNDTRAIFLLIPVGILLASVTLCLQYGYTIRKRRDEKKRRAFVKTSARRECRAK
ncbi:ionotropic receptor 25a [Harpegnathos saltator]|uniref:Glutamate receptor, ionotropic kainate 1 n=1 Tax=Harpegnathos saltator TaxID=610380 RepID=E2C5H8_HARSA|nr:ionotropic receptor 25a [Harpegnathos saltator]XP_025153384.1 ionotropic receptor 25a [Harpegnathos saltator]EFN76791.1 Glutamate receptor, ionotropic kainate 1 [Harpegnathos saltator]